MRIGRTQEDGKSKPPVTAKWWLGVYCVLEVDGLRFRTAGRPFLPVLRVPLVPPDYPTPLVASGLNQSVVSSTTLEPADAMSQYRPV